MKKYLFVFTLVFGVTFFVSKGVSFTGTEGRPVERQGEKVREQIETLKMWRLTEALDLDEKTASKLFPLIKRYDGKRYDIEREIREDMRRLRNIVDEASEKELKKVIERLKKNHRERRKLNEEEIEAIKNILTVRQQASYLIFKHDFNREMKRITSRARERRREGQRRTPGPRPGRP